MSPKKRRSLEEILCNKLDVPLTVTTMPGINVWGRREATVYGCSSIDKYSETQIELTTNEHVTRVIGKCLSLVAYASGKMEISGEIERIEFPDRGDSL